MPTPTIPAGNLFMNATLFTATGTTQTVQNGVAGQSFQPDFVWQKARNQAYDHLLVDSVRGASKYLVSDSTAAEQTQAQFLTSFNSDGFSLGTSNTPNGTTMVGWQWKAGGTAVTNTAGSITSQVSANTTSGFSVVTYTGNGTNLATVGHSLGVAPKFVIIRRRDTAQNWLVDVSNITGTTGDVLTLNTTNALVNSTSIAPAKPSSTVLTLGTDGLSNANTGTYVAYCWAPIAGYSAFGSYTGNGSADGAFIYTGFRPKFLLIKSTGVESWEMFDTSRDTYNQAVDLLEANSSGAENTSSTSAIDILSNGFKQRNTRAATNGSGQSYIYAAFAENPFKYANAR